jgi:WD40 repeat protein
MTKPGLITSLLLLGASLLLLSCAGGPAKSVTPTPDIPVLETRVAYKLAATLTAKAPPTATPTATFTPLPPTRTPIPTPSATPSPTPFPVETDPLLAFVRAMPDGTTNVILHNFTSGEEEILTHLQQPQSVSDVSWSRDGQWVVFASAHDYIHSRNNERNIFVMRPDGSGLHMVTGDYVDPERATGPFITLRGQVEGGRGSCIIGAQGAANAMTISAGELFELLGVPASARWVRAVCTQDEEILQGDIDLEGLSETTEAVSIPVKAQGQGWTQVSVSRDGKMIAGAFYRWGKDEEGQVQQVIEGSIVDLEGQVVAQVQAPPETTLAALEWSPIEDKLLGTLSGEKNTVLGLWDSSGASLGQVVEIPNPAQEILSASHVAWSPDGQQIAFGLRRWYWWGESRFKAELMVVSANGENLRTLLGTEWGTDADHPAWTSDGQRVYYQVSTGAADNRQLEKGNGDIWYVDLAANAQPVQWTEDGASYMPAANP